MKRFLAFTVSLLFSSIVGSQLKAQDLAVENSQLMLRIPVSQQVAVDIESDVDPAISLENKSLDYMLSIVVSDTDNVSAIHVTVNDEEFSSEITSHLFVYDDETPGAGLSYLRDGNSVLLGLGNFNYDGSVYYEVYLVDLNGNHSPVLKKNTL